MRHSESIAPSSIGLPRMDPRCHLRPSFLRISEPPINCSLCALRVQNTCGVMGVHVVPTDSLLQQMDAVLSDIGADVVKTGMLPNAAVRRRPIC